MKKAVVIHIHTDIKFISDVGRYESQSFENILVIIGDKKEYNGIYKESAHYFDYSRKSFFQILKFCQNADIVVVNSLDFVKSFIVNRLPNSVTVVWRFFGTELYSKMEEQVYSQKTLKIIKQNKNNDFLSPLKNTLKSYLVLLKYRAFPTKEFKKAAFQRVNYFLGVSNVEYDFLKKIWKDLPPFLQINYLPYKDVRTDIKLKSNIIILGNNKSAYNNHLDIIDRIKNIGSKRNFEFLILANYGKDSNYTKTMIKEAEKINEIKVVKDFMSMEMFNDLFSKSDAFVMNGHRQMGNATIFQAIKQNTKVYLNKKNVIYSWLKEEGFIVFNIEDFFLDLDSNNITLSESDALINQNQMVKFTMKYNKQTFQNSLIEILNDRTDMHN